MGGPQRKSRVWVWEHKSMLGRACLEQLQKMSSGHVAVAGESEGTVSYHSATVMTPSDHARARQALTAQQHR